MTALNLIAAPPLTLAEYAALPKQPRCELVKGKLVEQMAASKEHEKTAGLVLIRVGNHVLLNDLGDVYTSNRGYVTGPHSPATARMPDVSFVSNARLGRPDWAGMLYDGAPDLAVEILSPGNSPAEIAQKVAEYRAAGGQAVWVIDYLARTIAVHTADAPTLMLTDGDVVDGGDYLPGFACPVADMLPAR